MHTEKLMPNAIQCNNLLSESGTERMTPLPVPIHSRLHEVIRQLMRTKEKPSLLLPEKQRQHQ